MIEGFVQRNLLFAREHPSLALQMINRCRQFHREPPMRAIAAIPPNALRPNSWPNKIDIARYEEYFPDGGGRRGRNPSRIIARSTGKAIADRTTRNSLLSRASATLGAV